MSIGIRTETVEPDGKFFRREDNSCFQCAVKEVVSRLFLCYFILMNFVMCNSMSKEKSYE